MRRVAGRQFAFGRAVEVLLRDVHTGATLARFIVPGAVLAIPSSGDAMSAQRLPAVAAPADEPAPVAGRIEAAPGGLADAVAAWLAYLKARNRKPSTIAAYRQVADAVIREAGWSRVSDITFEAVMDWMVAKRDGGAWKATTYNRNLVTLRSLTGFLRRSSRVLTDPLADVEQAESDAGEGARAATTDEARAMVAMAWARAGDRRSKGNRALYWMCLFAHGCRVGEPEKWRWKHVRLEAPIPHIFWSRDIQKNHKPQESALAPELVGLLRAHRRALDAERASAGRPATRDEDAVFPIVPPRTTFRADARRAGIAAKDHRDRGFSPHSTRHWFATVLTQAGVAAKMVDYLMRHRSSVEARYYDPTLQEQAEVLHRLPTLWPGSALNLTSRRPDVQVSANAGAAAGPGRDRGPGFDPHFGSGNADFRTHNADQTSLADLLESLARLLRGAPHGHERRA